MVKEGQRASNGKESKVESLILRNLLMNGDDNAGLIVCREMSLFILIDAPGMRENKERKKVGCHQQQIWYVIRSFSRIQCRCRQDSDHSPNMAYME